MSAAALRADGAGDSTPGSDVGERITRLFPKCRPKNMQHQHDRLNSGLEGRENNVNNSSDEERGDGQLVILSSKGGSYKLRDSRLNSGLEGRENNVNNSSDEERGDGQLVILSSKGGSYKLRDSRIIEIAGGREIYSQSRAKAVRKLRHNNTHKHIMRNKVRALGKDTVDYATENFTNELPVHRINSEPKKMVSRHTSPSYTNGDTEPPVDSNNMGIPKNSSPILDPHKTNDVSTKSSPIAVVADGEVVVFDDNDDWKGLRTEPDASDDEIDMSVKRTIDNMKNGDSDILNNKSELSCDGRSESSPSREDARLSDASPSGVWLSGDEDKSRVTRVIGELPIAEYEGSPRRYGISTQKACNRSPRPGFPQRVVTESRDVTPPSGSTAFDYLYEFSETRKVLEEFFRCPVIGGHQQLNSNDEVVNFQDLDYELRRQTQEYPPENGLEPGSDSEWPHAIDALDSPEKDHNHTFLGLQTQAARGPRYVEPNVSTLRVTAPYSGSTSPAPRRETSVVVGSRRKPALSDDSTDTGSDLSLMFMESDLHVDGQNKPVQSNITSCTTTLCCRGAGNVIIVSVKIFFLGHSIQVDSARIGVSQLPVVEDGLSSGRGSDTDNNNQNHTVIIEEIIENGTSADTHAPLSDADLHSLDPL
ncbi:hypothetical protein ACJJTC_015556, partial [Scirpophaga incertulas]